MCSTSSSYEPIDDQVLNEKFVNIFRKSYVSVKGTTLPVRYVDFMDDISNMEVYDDDVWICSFPKTGTTWSQEMIWMIANDLDFEGAKVGIGERFPFLDYTFLFDYRDVAKLYEDFDPEYFLTNAVEYIKNKPRPRFIKTHLPWNLLPKSIQNGTKTPKIVYISRNPKDTCVSYYHHCRLIEGFTGNFEEFHQLFLDGKLSFAPFWSNVLPFWGRRNQSNVLFTKYEDLKGDLEGSVKDMVAFMDKDINEDQVELLLKHLSFETMKNNDAVNYRPLIEFKKKFKMINEEGSFIRAGKVGSYRAEMTDSIEQKFEDWIAENDPENELEYGV